MTATVRTLGTFSGSNGSGPIDGVIADANGDLFGTTISGGANGDGTVFELVNSSSAYTLSSLFSFNGFNGYEPQGGLTIDANGDLFGTTHFGGPTFNLSISAGDGTVFELVKGGSNYTLSTLVYFDNSNGSNGSALSGNLIADANGDLFGTAESGGTNDDGTVFELVKSGSSYTVSTLVNFNGTNGAFPEAGLIADANGDLFGTTESGSNGGTVFELVKSGSGYTLSTLATLGDFLFGSLIADANGDLFGTTYSGGANGDGTVFELVKSSSGYTLTTLVNFNGSNGANPDNLIADAYGDLFGATRGGGPNNDGTVFEVPLGGVDSKYITQIASKASIFADPFDFVGAYLNGHAVAGTASNPVYDKLTPQLEADLSDAGLQTVSLYETKGMSQSGWGTAFLNNPLQNGITAGETAYQLALQDGQGQNPGSAIYFAVDLDPGHNSTLLNDIVTFFRGVAQGFQAAVGGAGPPEFTVGVYGGGLTDSRIINDHLATYSWLAGSTGWTGSKTYTSWNIKQSLPTTINGVSVDPDINNGSYFGQWGGSDPETAAVSIVGTSTESHLHSVAL
jgi:uncharacterized repeat protein (TIGR03803 family)